MTESGFNQDQYSRSAPEWKAAVELAQQIKWRIAGQPEATDEQDYIKTMHEEGDRVLASIERFFGFGEGYLKMNW